MTKTNLTEREMAFDRKTVWSLRNEFDRNVIMFRINNSNSKYSEKEKKSSRLLVVACFKSRGIQNFFGKPIFLKILRILRNICCEVNFFSKKKTHSNTNNLLKFSINNWNSYSKLKMFKEVINTFHLCFKSRGYHEIILNWYYFKNLFQAQESDFTLLGSLEVLLAEAAIWSQQN